ncbi:hypothetical protein BSL78_20630 [Apostichopus japonicus]|uniref:Uncharacterized protein n=1 Tax=Stichopus japonicus TaxID=307972 RepID=A0A2G8K3C3_STIJA|nr:hypothetical protein BSL78_20630 [Apostichopus japonicus]
MMARGKAASTDIIREALMPLPQSWRNKQKKRNILMIHMMARGKATSTDIIREALMPLPQPWRSKQKKCNILMIHMMVWSKRESRKHRHHKRSTDATATTLEEQAEEMQHSHDKYDGKRESRKHRHHKRSTDATATTLEEQAEEMQHSHDTYDGVGGKRESRKHRHHKRSTDATATTMERQAEEMQHSHDKYDGVGGKRESRKHRHHKRSTDATAITFEGQAEEMQQSHDKYDGVGGKKKSRKHKHHKKSTDATATIFEGQAVYMQPSPESLEDFTVKEDSHKHKHHKIYTDATATPIEEEAEELTAHDSFEGFDVIYSPDAITIDTAPYPFINNTSYTSTNKAVQLQTPTNTPSIKASLVPSSVAPNKTDALKWRKNTTPKVETGPIKPAYTTNLEEKEVVNYQFDDITNILTATEEKPSTKPGKALIEEVAKEVQSYFNHPSIDATAGVTSREDPYQPQHAPSDDRQQRQRETDRIINKYCANSFKESQVYTPRSLKAPAKIIEEEIIPIANCSVGRFGRIIYTPLNVEFASDLTPSLPDSNYNNTESTPLTPCPPKTPHPPTVGTRQPRPPTARPRPPTARPHPPMAKPCPPAAKPRPPTAKPRPPTAKTRPPTAKARPLSSRAQLRPPSIRILLEPQRSAYKEIGGVEWKTEESSQFPEINQTGILSSAEQVCRRPPSTRHSEDEPSNNTFMPQPPVGPHCLDSREYRARRRAQRNQNVGPGGRVRTTKGHRL